MCGGEVANPDTLDFAFSLRVLQSEVCLTAPRGPRARVVNKVEIYVIELEGFEGVKDGFVGL